MPPTFRALTIAVSVLATLIGCVPDGGQPTLAPPSRPVMTSPDPKMTTTMASLIPDAKGMDWLPDGTVLITQRMSKHVLMMKVGAAAPTTLATFDDVDPSGEGGLLSVAVSRDFSQDRLVFFYYTTSTDNRVVKATLKGNILSKPEPLLVGIPKAATDNGGALIVARDGTLFVGTGDAEQPSLAQNPQSLAGKILHMTKDGQALPGEGEANPYVYSLGHSNVTGLALDERNRLLAAEVSSKSIDELNLVEYGRNYGWPFEEGRGGADRVFADPQVTFEGTYRCAPSGIAIGRENKIFLGCSVSGEIWIVPWEVAGGHAKEPRVFANNLGPIRAIIEGPHQRIWALAGDNQCSVYVLPEAS